MIDWLSLGINILWIAGLVLLLAVFSYNRCVAVRCKIGLSRPGLRPAPTSLIPLGFLLVSLGLAATSASWLERAIWLGIALVLIGVIVQRRRTHTRD